MAAAARFSVTVSGSPAPTIQWQKSTDAGTTFTNIAGATASTYSTPATTAAQTGQQVRVVVASGSATVTRTPAALTVASPAAVVGSASACTGAAAYAAGTTSNVVYDNLSSSGTGTTTTRSIVNGAASFHGRAATEIEATSTFVPPAGTGSGTITSDTRAYVAFDAVTTLLTQHGLHRTTSFAVTGGNSVVDDDGVFSPASVDARYQLNAGGTTSVATHQTVTTTVTNPGSVRPALGRTHDRRPDRHHHQRHLRGRRIAGRAGRHLSDRASSSRPTRTASRPSPGNCSAAAWCCRRRAAA